MANSGFEDMELPTYFDVKVHRLMCFKLKRMIDRIVSMLATIESARPRSSAAIQALCLLHDAVDKAKILIQRCSESSKLYLALMGDRILSRCNKLKEKFVSCLSRIQNMVPLVLAAEISRMMDELWDVSFSIESTEHDARQAILALLRRGAATEDSRDSLEFSMLFTACEALSISSRLALLMEKRSIKKLLLKLQGKESMNKKILSYLLRLLRKYGKAVLEAQDFNNPKEKMGLDESVSSVSLSSTDTRSLMESLESQQLVLLDDKDLSECYHSTGSNTELAFLTKLSMLPWGLQCDVVEDVKERLRVSDDASNEVMLSRRQIESLVRFLRDAGDLSDVKARGDGLEILLAVSNMNSGGASDMLGDVAHTITTQFHNPAMTTKSLELLDIVSHRQQLKSISMVSGFLPFILTALETRVREHEVLSLRILQNLSSCCEIRSHLLYLDVIPRLVRFVTDPELGRFSIEIIRSLSNTEEGKAAVRSAVTDSKVLRSLMRTTTGGSGVGMGIAEELCRQAHGTGGSGMSETSDSNSESSRRRFSPKLLRRLRRKAVALLKLPSRLLIESCVKGQ